MKLIDLYEQQVRPEIVVMVGLPASGKSTLIKHNYSDYTLVSSDDYIEKIAASQNKTYGDVFKDAVGPAHTNMNATFRDAIQNNENIVWDQTNLTKRKRRSILSQIPSHYKKTCVVFDVPEDIRADRQKGRKNKSIPDHVVNSMRQSFEMPTKDEGFDRIVVIND